jgi:pyridoxal phosphate enzyme (YggS family)
MMDAIENIRRNYEQVQEKITCSAQKVGRSPSAVKLVVVTKSQPVQVVSAAIDAGAKILGENYAEEGLEKIKAMGAVPKLEWHMIGHVQSRKAELVVKNFSLVHSLDSLKLAGRLNSAAEAIHWRQSVLIQVNVSGEESKFGYPAWHDDQISSLISEMEKIVVLPSLKVKGLMTVPPFVVDGELSRPFFQRLKKLRDQLINKFPEVDWSDLSMGMSADYEIAIEEGATFVRVGTAILGERIYPKG